MRIALQKNTCSRHIVATSVLTIRRVCMCVCVCVCVCEREREREREREGGREGERERGERLRDFNILFMCS